MVSIKALATVLFISAASAQTLFSCWCGSQSELQGACGKMSASGWMEGDKCVVSESRARDYFLKTACTSDNKGC